MPYAPTSPASVDVPSPVSQTLTVFHITDIKIVIDPNDSSRTQAKVTWVEGYMDGATFIEVKRNSYTGAGANFLTKLGEPTVDGHSYYDAVKKGFWDYLASEGQLPAGSMT